MSGVVNKLKGGFLLEGQGNNGKFSLKRNPMILNANMKSSRTNFNRSRRHQKTRDFPNSFKSCFQVLDMF